MNAPIDERKDRLLALDSMRGIAALTVLVFHLITIFPTGSDLDGGAPNASLLLNLLAFTPLRLFWAGHEAVYFFFVLSGFVLAIPLLKIGGGSAIKAYYVKRVFRIYPPYIVAVLIAVLASSLFYRGVIPELAFIFNHQWQSGVDWMQVLQHLSLIGSFDFSRYDWPVWSLVMEMRISLLFPLLIWLIRKSGWKTNLLVAGVTSGVYWMIWHWQIHHLLDLPKNYLDTLRYIGFFVIGGTLAKYRVTLVDYFRSINRLRKAIFLFVFICAYTNASWLNNSWLWNLEMPRFLSVKFLLQDIMVGLGIAGIIIVGLASRSIGGVLAGRTLTFLGKISYSLYLYHAICLLGLMHLYYGRLPTALILCSSAALSLLLAVSGYYLVEAPSIHLGRYFAARVKSTSTFPK
jgi:peptidoglycan/LPS O-acetylase OafA/YrhL